jgi:hypothetical protein
MAAPGWTQTSIGKEATSTVKHRKLEGDSQLHSKLFPFYSFSLSYGGSLNHPDGSSKSDARKKHASF